MSILFQAIGPATTNACSSKSIYVLGTIGSRQLLPDYRHCDGIAPNGTLQRNSELCSTTQFAMMKESIYPNTDLIEICNNLYCPDTQME